MPILVLKLPEDRVFKGMGQVVEWQEGRIHGPRITVACSVKHNRTWLVSRVLFHLQVQVVVVFNREVA